VQSVGLQIYDGGFRHFWDCDFYFDIHQIELKAFYAIVIRNHYFSLRFQNKQYWIIYDTQ